MLFPLWNPFHVLIVAIVLQYLLILIHTILLAWMIVYIMANARTLHGQTCSKKKKVFLVCIECSATNNNRSVNGSTHGVHKSTKTATKHAKTQQHMNSMKYWKKIITKTGTATTIIHK